MKTFAKVLGYGLVVLIIALTVGFTYKYTNGFNEDLKTFYVEYSGKQILTTESKLTLKKDAVHRFNVKYTFDKDDAEPKEYKVKIVPNMTRDFDFTVDGEKHLFSKAGELTGAFGIKKDKTYFELYLPESLTFSEILRKVYNGKTINVPSDVEKNNPYPFRLQISSYNDKVRYNIDFTFDTDGTSDVDEPNTPIEPTIPIDPDTPPAEIQRYNIGYLVGGDGTNLTNMYVDGPELATAGETVAFNITIYDDHYTIENFEVYAFGVQTPPKIIATGNGYQFVMPTSNVDIRIDLKYTAPTLEAKQYRIECDSLGWASMSVVNMNCSDRAAASESVTFTANVKSEYAAEYRISKICVNLGSGEEYIDELQENDGSYTFDMPDNATMEDETNGGYITLMFYIVPIDI